MSDEIRDRIENEVLMVQRGDRQPNANPPATVADALELAAWFDRYYEPSGKGKSRVPGLKDAKLPAGLGQEMRYLAGQIQDAHVAVSKVGQAFPHQRARVIGREVRLAIEWIAVDDPQLAELAGKLRAEQARHKGESDQIVALDQWLRVAADEQEALADLPAFDMALLDEGRRLVAAFSEPGDDRSAAIVARRDALMRLLQVRMRRIVKAADYVFRQHPAIARGSRSERTQRRVAIAARTRRARPAKGATQPASQPAAGAQPPTQPAAGAQPASQPAAGAQPASPPAAEPAPQD